MATTASSPISPQWIAQMTAAQRKTHEVISGKRYERLRLGSEPGAEDAPFCGDCGVERGQLHVPGCDVERCPACGGQAITCRCSVEA